MRSGLRRDVEGWSPVFLALLLWLLAMYLVALFGPPPAPVTLGVTLARSSDGTNWILTFTAVPSGLSQNSTSLTIQSAAGSALLNATTLYHLEGGGVAGVEYRPVQTGPAYTDCAVADTILISVAGYPAGSQVMITSPSSVLYTHSLA